MFRTWVILSALLFGALPCTAKSTQADLDKLRERMLVNEMAAKRATASDLKASLAAQKPDGSWAKINYTAPRGDSGSVNDHIKRLEYFAKELLHGVTNIDGYNLATQIGKGLNFYTQYTYTAPSGQKCHDRYAVAASKLLADQTKCQAGSTLFSPDPQKAAGNYAKNANGGNFTTYFNESIDLGNILLVLKHGTGGKAYFDDPTLSRWADWINSGFQQGFLDEETHTYYPAYATWNLTQVGIGMVCKGIIQSDVKLVDSVFHQIRLQMAYSGTKYGGRQYDESYNEHKQLYSGGYAGWFLNDLAQKWLPWGGNYSMGWSTDELKSVIDVVLDGFLPMTQFEQWDPSTMGRGISIVTAHRTSDQPKALMENVLANPSLYDNHRLNEVKAAVGLLQAKPTVWPWQDRAAKLFWTNDYATFHQGRWSLTYSYASSRIHAGEEFDNHNLKGIYQHFGVYWLHHQRAFDPLLLPVMDWAALPGLTLDRGNAVPASEMYPMGSGNFAGGAVSGGSATANSGTTAAIGYDYDVASIKGKKAAFFLDSYAVFLGAGLAFNKTSSVATTVNQQIANGPTWVQHKGAAPVNLGASMNITGNDIQSVWHDFVGYDFPTPAAMTVTVANRTGKWSDINKKVKASTDVVTQPLFTAWLNHGTSATSASYAYAIVPDKGQAEFAAWASTPPYSVEQNTASVQAVLAQDKNWHGVIFHQAGDITFSDKLYLKSDVPSAVILRVTPDYFYLSVADPAHKSTSVNLTLSAPLSGNGATWDNATKRSTIKAALGTDVKTIGKTVILAFKKIPPVGISEAPSMVSTHLFRSGDNLLVRELPVGTTHLTLVDVQGKILRAWAATSSEARLELPRQVQSGFLLIDGATRTSLAVPPRL